MHKRIKSPITLRASETEDTLMAYMEKKLNGIN